jgi:hypothetical protein
MGHLFENTIRGVAMIRGLIHPANFRVTDVGLVSWSNQRVGRSQPSPGTHKGCQRI